ncbi:hypothetical protein [Pantoea sp. PGP6]|jgi:hypothetical protein
MMHTNIKTYYIDKGMNSRLVRYDVIRVADDKFIVKVLDDQQSATSAPSSIVEIDTLEFTLAQYLQDTGQGGFQTMIRDRMPNSFEGHVHEKCQEHRNGLMD